MVFPSVCLILIFDTRSLCLNIVALTDIFVCAAEQNYYTSGRLVCNKLWLFPAGYTKSVQRLELHINICICMSTHADLVHAYTIIKFACCLIENTLFAKLNIVFWFTYVSGPHEYIVQRCNLFSTMYTLWVYISVMTHKLMSTLPGNRYVHNGVSWQPCGIWKVGDLPHKMSNTPGVHDDERQAAPSKCICLCVLQVQPYGDRRTTCDRCPTVAVASTLLVF